MKTRIKYIPIKMDFLFFIQRYLNILMNVFPQNIVNSYIEIENLVLVIN